VKHSAYDWLSLEERRWTGRARRPSAHLELPHPPSRFRSGGTEAACKGSQDLMSRPLAYLGQDDAGMLDFREITRAGTVLTDKARQGCHIPTDTSRA
jgi:hypothetical protein